MFYFFPLTLSKSGEPYSHPLATRIQRVRRAWTRGGASHGLYDQGMHTVQYRYQLQK